jgi:putative transferase (TIGR04331 family)
MPDQYTLVTTELEETWPFDGKVLFLGEWCRLHSRKSKWGKLDAKVVPYHWDNRKKLKQDFAYLQNLNHELLLELVPIMNFLHKIDHDENYWRLIIGFWLNIYTSVLFDRWSSIEAAKSLGFSLNTILLPLGNDVLACNDTADFINRSSEDPFWNHALFKFILQRDGDIKKSFSRKDHPISLNFNSQHADSLKLAAKKLLGFFSFAKSKDYIFMIGTYLPLIAQFRLELKVRQVPCFWTTPVLPNFEFDSTQRQFRLGNISKNSDFEALVRQLIPQLLPKVFIEGWEKTRYLTNRLPWPVKPKVIFTSSSHLTSDIFKVWVADKRMHGARLFIGEHGGFGVAAFNASHSFEIGVTDRYISSGWGNENKKITKIGNFRQIGLKVKPTQSGPALLVCGNMPRYNIDVRSMMLSSQVLNYLEDQFRFFDHLPLDIKQNLLVRLYHHDYEWDQKARWKERHPKVIFEDSKKSMWRVAKRCRLFISTYNATTYVDSLTLNFPTVVFWNPDHWEVKDEAVKIFEALWEVGIFHKTPESAAKHIDNIWDNVMMWWHSNEVQHARTLFCEAYSTSPSNLLTQIASSFETT